MKLRRLAIQESVLAGEPAGMPAAVRPLYLEFIIAEILAATMGPFTASSNARQNARWKGGKERRVRMVGSPFGIDSGLMSVVSGSPPLSNRKSMSQASRFHFPFSGL